MAKSRKANPDVRSCCPMCGQIVKRRSPRCTFGACGGEKRPDGTIAALARLAWISLASEVTRGDHGELIRPC